MFQACGERRQGAVAGQWDVMLIAAAGCNWVAGSEAEFGNDAARSTRPSKPMFFNWRDDTLRSDPSLKRPIPKVGECLLPYR
jgi:hypothetical protein